MTDITWLTPIFIAFAMAVVNTLLGFFKNTPPEDFSVIKFVGTIIIGLFIGYLTAICGWDYTTAEEWLASSGLTIWFYWIAKVIVVKLELPEKLKIT